jgi:hypothetical protein
MNGATNLEHRASSSQDRHEGEPSLGLCDRLDRTRDNSQRQLPTDHDYAVPTREYQTDQSSLITAPAAARSVFGKQQKQRQKQTHPSRRLTRSLHIRPMHSLSKGMFPPWSISPEKRRSLLRYAISELLEPSRLRVTNRSSTSVLTFFFTVRELNEFGSWPLKAAC